MVLLLETGNLIRRVTECGDCDGILLLLICDLINGATDRVWKL